MLRVPDVGSGDHTLTAGPLRVRSTAAGVLRIGWDEPDWLGPGRLVTPDAIAAVAVLGNGTRAGGRRRLGRR